MTETTYDVRIWNITSRKNKQGKVTSYRVRWEVAAHPFQESFKNKAQAESFRADLLSSARKGEAFVVETGLPVSTTRATNDMSWFDFACVYVDMKWRDTSPGQRKSTADSLLPISEAMLTTDQGKPNRQTLNRALRHAFNPSERAKDHPSEVQRALKWIAEHSRKVGELTKPDLLRDVLASLDLKLDGSRAAPDTIRLRGPP